MSAASCASPPVPRPKRQKREQASGVSNLGGTSRGSGADVPMEWSNSLGASTAASASASGAAPGSRRPRQPMHPRQAVFPSVSPTGTAKRKRTRSHHQPAASSSSSGKRCTSSLSPKGPKGTRDRQRLQKDTKSRFPDVPPTVSKDVSQIMEHLAKLRKAASMEPREFERKSGAAAKIAEKDFRTPSSLPGEIPASASSGPPVPSKESDSDWRPGSPPRSPPPVFHPTPAPPRAPIRTAEERAALMREVLKNPYSEPTLLIPGVDTSPLHSADPRWHLGIARDSVLIQAELFPENSRPTHDIFWRPIPRHTDRQTDGLPGGPGPPHEGLQSFGGRGADGRGGSWEYERQDHDDRGAEGVPPNQPPPCSPDSRPNESGMPSYNPSPWSLNQILGNRQGPTGGAPRDEILDGGMHGGSRGRRCESSGLRTIQREEAAAAAVERGKRKKP
uniref:Uncharacterized protein n=1 Tax=Chromera velia CCMP2878 TaxID=1169474 RepID=A0A0G4FS01_9ALVE|eukprot:Cvel_18474.t1-p1 / transcript=Cvel_18474.t1 / gene=Cvel_18474 / organism=Chromera_velia_CCMP2878 / gene_product=hypothetical protein / transcript_product=hypothetical protein / location=Cvel_scaffold1531:33647-37257(-) / protein_length=446 / sequence_SO=supercontig / SO=protein_coding / is_pseudo=false